ncbi:MAG: response regulator transcription factor [Armatimonadota bacterium]
MAEADILVVEDELPLALMIQANLARQGYTVRCAHDGKDALDMVEARHPDLMVLDIMLPTVSGWEVLQRLKTDPETMDIPIIVLTALGEDRDVAKGWGLGSDCYICKPFEINDLLTLVERFLQA